MLFYFILEYDFSYSPLSIQESNQVINSCLIGCSLIDFSIKLRQHYFLYLIINYVFIFKNNLFLNSLVNFIYYVILFYIRI